ncbi:OmpH family outer membrane protein [Streptomyces sp. NPDC052101]|uniref:OmpH family outer membrane protein n=1 Tax=Streptomyces sp. NPDC052101 TaxID=3155763 RepID=UPI003413B731
MGRYFYRAFNASDSVRSSYLYQAYAEFQSVINLSTAGNASPVSAQAAQWSDWLAQNMNSLGLSYDVWLKPDFNTFQSAYIGYTPMLTPLVQAVNDLILQAVAASAVSDQLDILNAEAANEKKSLGDDLKTANVELTDSQQTLAHLNDQMQDLTAEINAKKAELQQAQYEFEAELPLVAAWDTVQAVITMAAAVAKFLTPAAAAAAGGASAAAAAAAAGGAAGAAAAAGGAGIDTGVAGIIVPSWYTTQGDSAVAQTLARQGDVSNLASLAKEAGGLLDLVQEAQKAIGLFQNLQENNDATIKGDEAAIRQLTAQALELKFQLLHQQNQLTSAALRVEAAQARITACQNDIDAIQAAKKINVGKMDAIAAVVDTLLELISRLSEFVLRYVFLAARALDIFSFADGVAVAPAGAAPQPFPRTRTLPLDFGMVYPDLVADALLEMRRGGNDQAAKTANSQAALNLINALAVSWAQAPGWSVFTQQGIDMANNLSQGFVWVPINTPKFVPNSQNNPTCTFKIDFKDLPADTRELKIEQIYINLVGATTGVPSLTGDLEHSGYAQAMRLSDGATLMLEAPADTSEVVITCSSSAAVPTPSATTLAELPAYYGRSPVTTWTLTITDPSPVDLSQLSQIQVGIRYLTYLTPPPTPMRRVAELVRAGLRRHPARAGHAVRAGARRRARV